MRFDAGGGQGSEEPITMEKNTTIGLDWNPFTPTGDRHFIGWNVKVGDAEPVFMELGSSVVLTADIVVTAVWEDNVRYTVSFDGGGARGTMDAQSHAVHTGDYTAPACGFTAPTTMTFAGWKIDGDPSGTVYTAGSVIPLAGDVTLVAQWYSPEGAQILSQNSHVQEKLS